MEIKTIDPMTWYVLIGGILVIFVGLGLRQLEAVQKTIPLWVWSGLAGILVGATGAAFAVHRIETFHWANQPVRANSMKPAASAAAGGNLTSSGGRTGGGRGGTPSGAGNATGAGQGGAVDQRARRELETLVAKLDMVTRGVHLQLDAEQKSRLAGVIERLANEQDSSEQAAQVFLDQIRKILTPQNAVVLALINLPSTGRTATSNGSGIRPVGPQTASAVDTAASNPSPARERHETVPPALAGAGSGIPAPSAENSSIQDDRAKQLQSLRLRLRN